MHVLKCGLQVQREREAERKEREMIVRERGLEREILERNMVKVRTRIHNCCAGPFCGMGGVVGTGLGWEGESGKSRWG